MTRHRRALLSASIAIAAGLLFAVPAQAQQKTIRFSHTMGLYMAPVFVAKEKGWFTDALSKVGYRFEAREVDSGPVTAEAMAAQQIDIGQVGLSVIVTSISRGLPAKIVVNTGIAGEGIIVRADSPFKTMADLRGKTIAIPGKGTMPDFIVRRGLEKAKLDPSKDVKFVEISPADQKQALMTKLVDAATLWEPLATNAVLAGGRMLASGQEIYPNHQHDTIAATDAAISNHPAAVRAVVETIVRAQQWVMDNPEEAKTIAAKSIGLPRATIDAAWGNLLRRRDGRPSVESTQEFADFLYQWGYSRRKLDAASLIDSQFLPKVD